MINLGLRKFFNRQRGELMKGLVISVDKNSFRLALPFAERKFQWRHLGDGRRQRWGKKFPAKSWHVVKW